MSLDPTIKRTWQDIQSRHAMPVNALGVPINKDKNALAVWKSEGIDQFVKK